MSTLDAVLPYVADLHHSQQYDEVANGNLPAMINAIMTQYPGATRWIGLADILENSVGDNGPFAENISDLETVFNGAGITFTSLADAHDTGGSTNIYSTSIYEGECWSFDIGSKWRVLMLETLHVQPGYTVSSTALAWLRSSLAQAQADGKYVIVGTHMEVWHDIAYSGIAVIPSAATGTVTIEASGSIFAPSDVGKVINLRYPINADFDESCWGYGTITSFISDTSVTVNVSKAFPETASTTEWGYHTDLVNSPISNASQLRAIYEGSGVVKLVINGHLHSDNHFIINDIDYVGLQAATTKVYPANSNGLRGGGVLELYTDGTWTLKGLGVQTSRNVTEWFVSGVGANSGGAFPLDPCDIATMQTKAQPGDMINLIADVSDDINLSGTLTAPINISAYDGVSVGSNIFGNHLLIKNITAPTGKAIGASNSVIQYMEVHGG